MMRSGNPALKASTFSGVIAHDSSPAMTIQGTVNKTFLLMVILLITAYWAWNALAIAMQLIWVALIGGFIVAMVTVFKKEYASITGPIYAALEGVVLGGISAIMEQQYPGIVSQAVMLTFGVLFSLLMVYKSRLIPVTQNFRLGVSAATGGIALIYIISMVMRMFGANMPFIHDSGLMGIGFSLFVVVIASMNLVMDFDFIETGAAQGAPKYMEWYGAFGLMVTLVWLYLEILRLLAKLNRR